MNDRIRELGFFLRVSEEESFSAAARTLDLDPSTISKVIQRLENRLGVRLFHRTSRVLQLTQEGEQFLAAAQKVMQALEEAEASVGTAVAEASGVLRVSSTAAFARRRLAPLVPTFLAEQPLVRLEIIVAATPPDLFEQQIDISFQSGNIPDSTLVARRITTAHWHLCAAPAYLARAGMPKSPDDLHGHHCLNFLPGSFRSRWPLKTSDQVLTHEPKAIVAANNGDVLCTLVTQGLGIARLADYHIDAELAAGQLVIVLPEFELDREPIYAVFPSKRHLSARVRAFLEHAGQALGD
ncbi:MAG: LysR family transcriptional regulator [Rubrivivax sp.]|nr:LysR family transcriptional regulator [Rubrivivax sp.]MCL4696763.1 LysR family transcriptional regulator [Burkholderiaceae bacterium]